MNTLQGIILGNSAADTFLLLDDESVGRIVRALVYYSFHGERPAVPKPLRATFYAIYRESCRARRKSAVAPTAIPFADTPEDAQAQDCAIVQESAKAQDCAIGANRAEENRIEENSPAVAGDFEKKLPARAREKEVFLDDLAECPIDAKELEVLAAHIGMTPEEVSAWKDYYTAQGWRRWPNSPRPMTATAARASLRFWHTKRGIEAAREAHIDAKMDERAAKRDAARDNRGPAPTDYEALEAAKRRAEAESPVVVGFDENGLAILAKKGTIQPCNRKNSKPAST